VKVGDLVRWEGSEGGDVPKMPATGIVLQMMPLRARVHWFVDAEASWEPKRWMKVINESG
tara:strand:+ start:474 stop:653 length:180 start_codon:yes stop_codon:yes gene_type:complete